MLNVILQWLPLSVAGLAFIFAVVAWRKERQLRASYETKFAAIETVLKILGNKTRVYLNN